MPSGHGNWTVSDDGCGGIGAAAIIAIVAAAVIAAVAAVVAFALAHAAILAFGLAAICVVLTASTWALKRWCTVLYWNPAAMRRRPQQALTTTTVVIHRHVIEYAPSAIQNPNAVVTAAVIATGRETEEIPR
jgi:hypothetical protein